MIRLTLCLFLLLVAVPSVARATTFWDDDFERATLNNVSIFWDANQLDIMPHITTNMPFAGTRSLEENFNGPNGGGYMSRSYTRVPEVWSRLYRRTNAFTYEASTATKGWQLYDDQTGLPNFWMENVFGSRQLSVTGQGVAEQCPGTSQATYDTCVYHPNLNGMGLNDDTWYCIETHLKMNTPDVSNGVIEIFITPVGGATVQTHGWYAQKFRGPNANGTNGNSSNAQFMELKLYRQAGVGTMWYDNVAVGDTRIGCGGSAPPQPPGVPSGITVTKLMQRIWPWLIPDAAWAR
jgi:hypothetical protein